MRLNILFFCKQGKIQLTDDDMLRIRGPIGTIWQSSAQDVTGFSSQPGTTVGWITALNVTIHARAGSYTAETVTKANFEKLQAAFPHLQTQQAVGKEWYHNLAALTHVETYTDRKKMQREVEAAGQYGWIPQTSAGVGSHINVGRTMTKFVLTGGLGMMTGASRSKEKIAITFVRSPEWLANQQK